MKQLWKCLKPLGNTSRMVMLIIRMLGSLETGSLHTEVCRARERRKTCVIKIEKPAQRGTYFFAYSRAVARYFMWHAREYAIRHVS